MSDLAGLGGPLARIGAGRLLPVASIEDPATAEPLGRALKAGGLPCVEVTLRTPTALISLRRLAEDPELVVGAGTVRTVRQAEAAQEAGATFIVSPGLNLAVVRAALASGLAVLPGVATATELGEAADAGLDHVKFFPAAHAGGAGALAALRGPFPQMRFVPTGGVRSAELPAYLALPEVAAVGGSWMVRPDLLAAGRFDEVARLTAQAVDTVRAAARLVEVS